MNGFDILIAVISLFFIIRGWIKGFILEFFHLLAIFISLFLSFKFYILLSKFFLKYVNYGKEFVNISSFLIVFLASYLVIFLIRKYLLPVEKISLLKIIDKILGAITGFLISAMVTYGIGYLIMFFYKPLVIQHSKIFPYYEKVLKILFEKLA